MSTRPRTHAAPSGPGRPELDRVRRKPSRMRSMSLPSALARTLVIGLFGGLALLAILAVGRPAVAPAAEVSCPKFRVMHNDRIGKLYLPAGWYDVTLLNGDKLTCPQSTKLFAEFLQDWDGNLRKPWVVNVKRQEFTRGPGSDTGFRVKRSGSSGGGGSKGGGTSASCPGYFNVLHKDRIGRFVVPRGPYRITLLNPKLMNCAQATARFRQFLVDFDGVLPRPWRLDPMSATFFKNNNREVGFNINRAYGPAPNPKRNTTYSRCPATFRVLHNDRIGQLMLPAGPYYVHVLKGLSCSSASNYFRQFLLRPDGVLPRPWRLNPKQAVFRAGKNRAFRVQQA